jgi:L-ascorbate metabolism protein UlaG (beta-lactamase superfamily)
LTDKRDDHKKDETSNCTASRRGFIKGVTAAAIGGAATSIAGPIATASASFGHHRGRPHAYRTSWEPACIGGPVPPKNSRHAIFRRLGTVNFEICYRGQVFLFDNYYDIVPDSLYGTWRCPELGFRAEDVTRATAIFVGHAHFDHMADTAQVALQTGAPVYGHQTVADKLIEQGVSPDQITIVEDGDVSNFRGLQVEAVHMYHSSFSPTDPPGPGKSIMPAETKDQFNALTRAEWGHPPLSEAEKAFLDGTKDKGSWDRTIRGEGTYGFLFTFGRDFTALMYDSHNPEMTPAFQALIDRLGSVDIGTVGFQGGTAERLSEYVWPVVMAYKAKYLWPIHNDTTPGFRLHASPQHLALLAKDSFPDRHTIIPLYREPVCFDVRRHKRVSLDMD